ncbi:MAG: hypothetical protein ACPGVY_16625, partial [Mycobacterium sp.]
TVASLVEISDAYKAGLVALVIGDEARSPAEEQIERIREVLRAPTEADARESEVANHSRRLAANSERESQESPPQSKAEG